MKALRKLPRLRTFGLQPQPRVLEFPGVNIEHAAPGPVEPTLDDVLEEKQCVLEVLKYCPDLEVFHRPFRRRIWTRAEEQEGWDASYTTFLVTNF